MSLPQPTNHSIVQETNCLAPDSTTRVFAGDLEYYRACFKIFEITPAIRSGLDNLEKLYQKTDQMGASFICLSKNWFDMQTNNPDFQ